MFGGYWVHLPFFASGDFARTVTSLGIRLVQDGYPFISPTPGTLGATQYNEYNKRYGVEWLEGVNWLIANYPTVFGGGGMTFQTSGVDAGAITNMSGMDVSTSAVDPNNPDIYYYQYVVSMGSWEEMVGYLNQMRDASGALVFGTPFDPATQNFIAVYDILYSRVGKHTAQSLCAGLQGCDF